MCQISLAVKKFFRHGETYFLTNSSFRLMHRDFLSSRKSIFLFRALLKLLKFVGGNSCLQKLILWLLELTFSHFSDTLSSESYFPSSGNVFLNKSSNQWRCIFCLFETVFSYLIFFSTTLFPLAERDFLSCENYFILICASFRQPKPLLKLAETSSLYFL